MIDRRRYLGTWIMIVLAAAGAAAWLRDGEPYLRRSLYAPAPIPDAARTESRFLAVLFPRVSANGEKFTISASRLEAVMEGLARRGYVSVSLSDVRAFYAKKRRLPPKAILLAFDKDYPRSVQLADAALRRARMRGTLFINGLSASGAIEQRKFLTAHAAGQLLKGRAWELGWIARPGEPAPAPGEPPRAVLDYDGPERIESASTRRAFRFVASETGYNDEKERLDALNMLNLDPDLDLASTIAVVEASWPRDKEFVDRFDSKRLAVDWIAGWGSVSVAPSRLALIATPRLTGAGLVLRGTERWRDAVLEFELARYRKEFWAYARYRPDGRFVRVGARDGYWYVEQKAAAGQLPRMLGRAPILPGAFPARIRLVVKDDWAIVHVNGRMQFGRALRLHPEVAFGQVQLAVYDSKPRGSLALVNWVKAGPLGREWIALDEAAASGSLAETSLEALRQQAALAHAISPPWLRAGEDGSLLPAAESGDFISSLAGFYRCRVVPALELPAGAKLLGDARAVQRLSDGVSGALQESRSSGVNVRLARWSGRQEQAARLLERLRAALRPSGRKVWVTLEGPGTPEPVLIRAVDGILRPARGGQGFELLKASET